MDSITVAGKTIERRDIYRTIALCDSMGRRAFLKRYGYNDSRRYVLRHGGRSYPSKAILGVAARLKASDFFGGAAATVRQLTALGFQVRDTETGSIDDLKLDILRRRAKREGLDVDERPWPELEPAPLAYFASGSNRPAEIRGFTRAGTDIGVTVSELSREGISELHELKGSDVLVFVDSGAFSEMGGRPITHQDWMWRLGIYTALAGTLGSQAWIVAPDKVGDQSGTLARLGRYRREIDRCRHAGARILLPIQKGEMLMSDFATAAVDVLGFDDFVPAFPCKKAATAPEECRRFIETWCPKHVHFLGLGIRSPKLTDYVLGLETTYSLDSCWLAANVGRGKSPRRFTRARDCLASIIKRLGLSLAVSEAAAYTCMAGSGLVAI